MKNYLNGEHEVTYTCLHCIVNEHGSFVVFLSKCLDLIVVYVLKWGSSNAAAWRKKIIKLKQREKCETIKRSPPSK